MQYVSDTDAKQRFDALLDTARHEPVVIHSNDEEVAILLSMQEYDRLRGFRLAKLDKICEQASQEAKARGLTEEKLAEILADKD